MKMHTRQKGFLLIELIIYMGLLMILLAIMSDVFVATLNVKLESDTTSAVQQDGSYIMSRIAYDVRRSTGIITPALGQSGTTLSLDIVENGVHKTYQYVWANNALTLSDGLSTDSLHGNNSRVTQFSVTHVGNSATIATAKDTISTALVVSSVGQTSSGVHTLTFQSTIGER